MIKVSYDDPHLDGGVPDAGGGATFFYKGEPFTGIIQYFYPLRKVPRWCERLARTHNNKI